MTEAAIVVGSAAALAAAAVSLTQADPAREPQKDKPRSFDANNPADTRAQQHHHEIKKFCSWWPSKKE